MANDSKLGMLAGLSAVLVVAVVYYQKAPPNATATASPPARVRSEPRPASLSPHADPILFPVKSTTSSDVLLRDGE